MIGVCIPTRGLLFTEVIDSVLDNLKGLDYKIYFSNNLPIPECFETTVTRALEDGCDYIWLVEEDTVPPKGGLKAMLDLDANYTAIDYSLSGFSTVGTIGEDILWTGFGCTLIKRKIFDDFGKPYFTIEHTIELSRWGKTSKLTFKDKPSGYGGQDIAFGIKCNDYGYTITPVKDMECQHLRIEGVEKNGTNWGCHKIYALEPIITKWDKGQYNMDLLIQPEE